MQTVKVRKSHTYAGEFRKKGTIYKLKDRDARVLIAIRTVEPYVEPPVEQPKPRGRPRKEQAETPKAKRTYRRKDLQAEAE